MVEINTADVRQAGGELYPALAGIYGDALDRIGEVEPLSGPDSDDGSAFEGMSSLTTAFTAYLDQARLYLDTSKRHLEFCGETLVEVADEHDWTDADNAHGIADSWASSKADEESRQDDQ